jgi:hypothetical protein
MGSFEPWSTVVGGIVTSAGYEGFLGNRQEIYELADSESMDWSEFAAAWGAAYGMAPQSVSVLRDLCIKNDLLPDVLGDGTDRSQATRLGKALAAQRDRSYNGLRIELARDGKHKGKQYRVVPPVAPAGGLGEPGGTLQAQGSPSQATAEPDSYDDGGTLGNVLFNPGENRPDLDDPVGHLGRDQGSDEASRPEGVRGSPRSPADRSAALIEGSGWEPLSAEVPATFPEFPSEPRMPRRHLGSTRTAAHRGRAHIDELDSSDICCVASRRRPGP